MWRNLIGVWHLRGFKMDLYFYYIEYIISPKGVAKLKHRYDNKISFATTLKIDSFTTPSIGEFLEYGDIVKRTSLRERGVVKIKLICWCHENIYFSYTSQLNRALAFKRF